MEAGVHVTGRATATSAPTTVPRAAAGTAPSTGGRAAARRGLHAFGETLSDYIALTKPRVISLLLVTSVCAMFVADPRPSLLTIVLTVIGGYLAAGGAGAINHSLEREIDGCMSRTSRRPLPCGRVSRRSALVFGIVLGLGALALFAAAVNMLAALLAMMGLLGYVFVYTLWLKPRTSQNIVVGGAAGAIPPLVGWAAATGTLTFDAFVLFAIVFYWTPPHFWALALLMKDDYARAGVPMMPVVDGDAETRRQILLYGWLTAGLSLLPVVIGMLGLIYAGFALALSGLFVGLCLVLYRRADQRSASILFHYSLLYLALLFAAMVLDSVL
jgi:protoheme IX farnesyltransferase